MRRQENRSEEMAKSNGKREEKNTFHVIDMEEAGPEGSILLIIRRS